MNLLKRGKIVCLTGLMSMALVTSCLKEGTDTLVLPLPDGRIPYSVISEALQDSLTHHGMIIHEGVNPPMVVGTYLVAPMTKDYASDNAPGSYVNLLMSFANQIERGVLSYQELQNTDLLQIPVTGQSIEANIIGSDSNFTVYCYQNVVEKNGDNPLWRVKTATVVSGTMSTGGIYNCQYSVIILEREIFDSNYESSIPVEGTFRLFHDGDNYTVKL